LGLLVIVAAIDLQLIWVIVQVAIGLGAVIFVHELGHFLVAKACGVKCEKFYVGFDIAGLKLLRFQRGETEYGIGILPLGGYVKMLGQDDNPARIAAEMERARVRREQDGAGSAPEGATSEGTDYTLDPRSYLAKSVPQRMAIISAGVVMNVIFAFVFAVIAYGLGVKYLPCVVSEVIPGSPAWQAGLQIGDEIVQIGDLKKPRFRDLRSGVSLNDPDQRIPLVVRRPGVEQPLTFELLPDSTHGIPTIGIKSPRSLTLYPAQPFVADSPAAAAEPPLEGGDVLRMANGVPLQTFRDLVTVLAQERQRPLVLALDRPARQPQKSGDDAESIEVRLAPDPMKTLGLVMRMGPITAVQSGSPASTVDLQPGDVLETIDGQPIGDPVTLPQRFDRLAAEQRSVTLGRVRDGERRDVQVPLRAAQWYGRPDMMRTPMGAPSLGIAYEIVPRVTAIDPAGPAAKHDVRVGDEIVNARFVSSEDDVSDTAAGLVAIGEIPFSEEETNWPAFHEFLQNATPAVAVELSVRRDDQDHKVVLRPVASGQWFTTERGLILAPIERTMRAESFTEAVVLGARETKDALLMVYRFLQRIAQRHISPRLLGGPVTIAKIAGESAFAGPAMLLIFLTVLSANLAVINFLPIPLLDGGHMVFLIVEGIRGRPVSERFVVALHTIGFVLLVGLMLFVIALDLQLIPRGL